MWVGLAFDNTKPHLILLSQNFPVPVKFQEPVTYYSGCEQTLKEMFEAVPSEIAVSRATLKTLRSKKQSQNLSFSGI